MIRNFDSIVLQMLWETGNKTLLPNTYVYQVIDILDDLDDAALVQDLINLGGFEIEEQETYWAVTITVNSVEPIGSITCRFSNGDVFDVDLNEYE